METSPRTWQTTCFAIWPCIHLCWRWSVWRLWCFNFSEASCFQTGIYVWFCSDPYYIFFVVNKRTFVRVNLHSNRRRMWTCPCCWTCFLLKRESQCTCSCLGHLTCLSLLLNGSCFQAATMSLTTKLLRACMALANLISRLVESIRTSRKPHSTGLDCQL